MKPTSGSGQLSQFFRLFAVFLRRRKNTAADYPSAAGGPEAADARDPEDTQKSAEPVVRGKGRTSRMLDMPVT